MAEVKHRIPSPLLPTIPGTTRIDYPKWFGGSASCMAVVVSHPLDLVKVRMQMDGGARQGTAKTAIRIVQSEGISGLYSGLSAGLMRQLTYGSVRIGLYESIKEKCRENGISLNAPALAMVAATTGFVGAMFGTPSDIANIRMQNDRSLPPASRRNYAHVLDAWVQMKRTEGWRAFTQGLWPNCVRCAGMTASQLASYDVFKGLLMSFTGTKNEHPVLHVFASLLASLVATTVCSPMDVIKTQLMGSSGQGSTLKVIKELTATEGLKWIFRGWTPSFVRLGPQTMATLVLLEQHKRMYRAIKGVDGASL
ncbi:mitochondrial carrier [Aspergillus steynii IBT 23096]|uniref:Mitochondrial carrier n=1 Tax=Aspergillus steynii IBT 23096 TaxID=1392250 RepID=A0A2I2FRY4_9EURO|nr:mitochondrial carrier [Aspergillus steynii IBT 23096]PLB43366.1 mitochondrial carrier [Aspergillus steynii IBT 23096]